MAGMRMSAGAGSEPAPALPGSQADAADSRACPAFDCSTLQAAAGQFPGMESLMQGDYYSLPQFMRQQQERADETREGPRAALVSIETVGVPTGRVWGLNPARPGPLDGQPERRWFTRASYSDGSKREWGPAA